MVLEKLAEKKRLASQLRGAQIQRKQIAEFVAEYGRATRFQHDQRYACINLCSQNAQNSFEIFLGLVEKTEIVKRSSTAQMKLRDDYVESRALQNFQCCTAGFRMKIIVECVRPQNDVAFSGCRSGSVCSSQCRDLLLPGPTLKSGTGKLRHAPLRRQMQNALQKMAEARRIAEEICKPRDIRSELRPAVDHAKGVSMQWPSLVLIVVSQEFCFVSGDIHVCRAFRLARLAGEAQVEGFLDVLVL